MIYPKLPVIFDEVMEVGNGIALCRMSNWEAYDVRNFPRNSWELYNINGDKITDDYILWAKLLSNGNVLVDY